MIIEYVEAYTRSFFIIDICVKASFRYSVCQIELSCDFLREINFSLSSGPPYSDSVVISS